MASTPPQDPRKSSKRNALGRGLDALLPAAHKGGPEAGPTVVSINVALIDPNPVQPRAASDAEALQQLADSIKADGVLQPVLLRPHGHRFTLVVGERRLRACQLAGLTTIPAIVRDFPAEKLLEVTLVENIQREDLNPLEVATALQRMLDDLELSHEQLAARTGMSRTAITNHLRLLKLSPVVQRLVRRRELRMGHARALVPVEDAGPQEALARRAAQQGLSVRQVERLVRALLHPPAKRPPAAPDPNEVAALEDLERILQAPVRLRRRGKRGHLEIAFSSEDELVAIYDRIAGQPT